MIQNISIEKLYSHPDNPRKDLGDLSELAESIKAQGILQNLTVVPRQPGCCPSCKLYNPGIGKCKEDHDLKERPPCWYWESKGEFTVVIGNRRLAASKIAGLTELPCVVSDMDHKEQVGTMLLENIQRADLTVYEQAQGFQMMLDLGDTVKDIAVHTGFSETTVRRRTKLLELDREKFKDSVGRGATLMDYAELEKIENIELRNSVLEKIGTSNFYWELQRAIDKEKNDKARAELIAKLDTFATQVESSDGLHYIREYYGSDMKDFQKPEDAGIVRYFYKVANWGITLYDEAVENKEDTSAEEKRELREARYSALNEITERAFTLRCEFVKSLSNANAKKNIGVVIEYALNSMLDYYRSNCEIEDLVEMFEITEEKDEWEFGDIVDGLRQQPERYLLIAAYCGLDSKRDRYFGWDCAYRKNEDLERVYKFIEALGYEISDEEQALRDGSHELFLK